MALMVASWLVSIASISIHASWPSIVVGILVLSALSMSHQQGWLLRALVLLSLALPLRNMGTREPDAVTSQAAATPSPETIRQDNLVVRRLVDNEETLLDLNNRFTLLGSGLRDLRLPGPTPDAEDVFGNSVDVVDLLQPQAAGPAKVFSAKSHAWPVSSVSTKTDTINLWRPLLDQIAYLEQVKLELMRGTHPNDDRWRFLSTARFRALAFMKSGEWRSLDGEIAVTWNRTKHPDSSTGPWKITHWETSHLHWRASPRPLFTEALDKVIRSTGAVSKLRRSQHYEATVRHYRQGMQQLPHPYFAPISANQKEGIAIVDVNNDGLDDIYITLRIGKNMLLVNQGDGTFLEQGASYKLDLPGHTTCSLFADFDNDGDQDVILGRSLLKTSYLENRDGVFHQHPIPPFMPMAVISMAAADYNMDGLLDVYICTYRPAAPMSASPAGGVAQGKDDDFDWPDEFFDADLARKYKRRESEHRQRKGGSVLDQLGPPNVLLVNRGNGQFEPARENPTVGIWRNSLQATWADYNMDGRPDLYIANDWGLDVLFQNDASGGFTDVTQQAGLTAYGYAMGATWGDYDNDGLEDLYVSNMYSEAGRRITDCIPGLDTMFTESAAGNWLYRQGDNGKFTQVAGMRSPSMTVMNAGWSWGGGFADFDNDTFLDLYVLSGYFTAPKELASGLDLESNLWRTMVRTDPELSRSSFRSSPEWKRTSAPENLGAMIDARLAGVDRNGDSVRVHSLNGSERNHYFSNHAGGSFGDVSALSGLDNQADSRGFAVLDYDRDGWQDVVLVNANQPLFNLYHNEMEQAGLSGGMIAIRFIGGNQQGNPSDTFTCRDGFGARVKVDLGREELVREHRCGEGWSIQNSSTMLVGIGSHPEVVSLTVTWPSGRTSITRNIPEGTLLKVYENPDESTSPDSVERSVYRTHVPPWKQPPRQRLAFPVAKADTAARTGFQLRVYTTFSSSSMAYTEQLPRLKYVREILGPEGVDFIAVPVDPEDGTQQLAQYAEKYRPSTRLMGVAQKQRLEAAAAFARIFGTPPPLPSSVITDGAGQILAIQEGMPGISMLRRQLRRDP